MGDFKEIRYDTEHVPQLTDGCLMQFYDIAGAKSTTDRTSLMS